MQLKDNLQRQSERFPPLLALILLLDEEVTEHEPQLMKRTMNEREEVGAKQRRRGESEPGSSTNTHRHKHREERR